MIISPALERLLFLALFASLIVASFTRPRHFLFALGFVIPLMIPRADIGVGLDWYKLIGPFAVALALVLRPKGVGIKHTRVNLMLSFVAYATIVTCVWMFFEYNYLERYRMAAAMELGGGLAQNKLKMPVQLGSFLGQLLAVFAVPLWASNLRDCRFAIAGAMLGVASSVGIGLVNLALFGLGTVNTSGLQGVLVYTEYNIARIGGLSGEPKLLGVCLGVLLAYVVGQQVFAARARRAVVAVLAVIVALFATYSTSGWAAGAGALGVCAVVALTKPAQSRIGLLAVMFGAGLVTVTSVGFVGSMLDSRLIERVFGETGDLDQQKDMYVFRALADAPIHSVFGFGLGGGDFAVIPYVEWLHLKYKRTPTPGVTGVRLLADLGVIGVVMAYSIAGLWARFLARCGDHAGAAFMLAGLTAALLGSMMGLTLFYFLAGALLTSAAVAQRGGQVELTPVDLRGHAPAAARVATG